jgi:hypothetical protein
VPKHFAKSAGDAGAGSVGIVELPVDPDAVRQQLERLMANPLFSHSRRYSSLLRYVVEEALDGRSDRLKERTVGIDVFGRDPSYDTNADPVVRTTAAQLRHRIAQYYSQPERDGEVRISLPPGAYVPEFRPAASHKVLAFQVEAQSAVGPVSIAETLPQAPPDKRGVRLSPMVAAVICAAVLIAFAFAGYTQFQSARQDASLRKFWGPVWDSRNSVLICIGGGQLANTPGSQNGITATAPTQPAAPDAGPTISESLRANSVAWPDAMVTAELTGLARTHGQAVRLRKSGLIAFADLRESPDILVGGFNNQWIMRLDANLRYRYVRDAGDFYIQDQQHPELRNWNVQFRQPYSAFLTDYGVITRVLDPSTEKMVVIASGIASYGTMAAGDFLTQEKYMKMLADRAPKGWERRNMQVVFSTEVISGNAGPPRILAMYFW